MSEEEKSLLTPMQELFCQKYFECKFNASEAYRQSYNAENSSDNTIWTNAYKLLRNTHVKHRIHELFDIQAERLNVTVDTINQEYEEIRALAKKSGDYAPAVSAITGKAKLFGLLVDKNEEVNKKPQISITAEMPPEQAMKYYQQYLKDPE